MKHQTKKDKMDESLGMRRGKESTKKQSMKDRRDESEGASHPDHHHKAIMHHMKALHKMAKGHHKKMAGK
jgi:hypothetical protein